MQLRVGSTIGRGMIILDARTKGDKEEGGTGRVTKNDVAVLREARKLRDEH
eukprot:CAMPEP_0183346142 /NCGR_PEP_ID=MMETSP0164_2-20130417/11347_1 /TAXON_ID=221442 /ORGANISM="Coccolithus pelagicus ssp braarudi, Strain PLY182g" /LENGTH=50 /DNA_ID=CAMNT_0025517367 /DNA_START=10 /DNA_END=162 /DNA_ORIENTATION=-